MEKERVKEDVIFAFIQKLKENTKDKIYISPFGLQSVVITKPFKKGESYYFLYHNVRFCIQYQPNVALKVKISDESYGKEVRERTLLELMKEIVSVVMEDGIEEPVLVYQKKGKTLWIYKSKFEYEQDLKRENFFDREPLTSYDCVIVPIEKTCSDKLKTYQKKKRISL